jgi:hypothetical protein
LIITNASVSAPVPVETLVVVPVVAVVVKLRTQPPVTTAIRTEVEIAASLP